MLCNDALLFVHVPKTGGMSLTRFLLETLPGPVHYFHPDHDADLDATHVIQHAGIRHESLSEAAAALGSDLGRRLEDFEVILAVVRNPYALEVSRFAYLQKGHPWDRGYNQTLAMEDNFETFAVRSRDHAGKPIGEYLAIAGQTPPNLYVSRAETLDQDVSRVLSSIGVDAEVNLPVVNTSHHDPYTSYYTPTAEKAVYERYRVLFERGFYQRMGVTEMQPTRYGHRVPMVGPVQQVGPSSGLYPDLWATSPLYFSVRPDQAVTALRVSGWRPARRTQPAELELLVDERPLAKLPGTTGKFKWEVPLTLDVDQPARCEIRTSPLWSPADEAQRADHRRLAFRLSSVAFDPR
ncbi:MAG: sulfotransferase family protein [Actinobacteria bacterium]|nr:sulfotransferase family protein [Actinomycetota bacterium]